MHYSDILRLAKHHAALIGLDSIQVPGHSPRVRFVTNAAVRHARPDEITEVTRHLIPSTMMIVAFADRGPFG